MDLGLSNRSALVTGASRGIGRAIGAALHAEGCRVALNARDADALAEAASAMGDRVSIHPADVTDAAACRELVAAVADRWDGLDVLVCNVGSGASVPPGQETPDEWQRVFDLNLWATTNMVEAARPRLAERGGAIVCISSICGLAALGAPATYSAAKAALNAYVGSIARVLAADGVRINAVAPGNVLFEGGTWARKLDEDRPAVQAMLEREVALGRLGRPEEIADMVCFLASPRAGFATAQVFVLDGGQLRS